MTLAEMADLVCSRVGRTDPASLALCKTFINRRYRLAIDSALWNPLIVPVTPVSSFQSDGQAFVVPHYIDQVVAVKYDTNEPETNTSFTVSGEASGGVYEISWQWPDDEDDPEGWRLNLITNGGIDSEILLDAIAGSARSVSSIDLSAVAGQTVSIELLARTGGATVDTASSGDFVPPSRFGNLSGTSEITHNWKTLDYAERSNLFQLDSNIFERDGEPTNFSHYVTVGCANPGQITGTSDFIVASSDDASDAGKKVFIRDSAGNEDTITLSGLSQVLSQVQFNGILTTITKEVTAGTVSVSRYGGGLGYVNLAPAERARRYPTIQVFPSESDDIDRIKVLGKRRAPDMTSDYDEPLIPCEDALIAYAQADMLEKARQYAKAEKKRQEGYQEIQKLKELHTNQSANIVRIIPACYPSSYDWPANEEL